MILCLRWAFLTPLFEVWKKLCLLRHHQFLCWMGPQCRAVPGCGLSGAFLRDAPEGLIQGACLICIYTMFLNLGLILWGCWPAAVTPTVRYRSHLGCIRFQMCWEISSSVHFMLKFSAETSGQMDQESLSAFKAVQLAWTALTLAIHWELLCEASCGSQALLLIGQVDKDSYKLKVIPVERQRTLSQEHPSWD